MALILRSARSRFKGHSHHGGTHLTPHHLPNKALDGVKRRLVVVPAPDSVFAR
jgi:hypothetical protein